VKDAGAAGNVYTFVLPWFAVAIGIETPLKSNDDMTAIVVKDSLENFIFSLQIRLHDLFKEY